MSEIALSLVVPCYRKLRELRVALPFNARYLGRRDVELVLVLDEPSQEAEVLALLDRLPLVRTQVIVNDQDHAWRPPCTAINVGLRAANGRFVMVTSPESVFAVDAPTRVLDVLTRRPQDVLLGRIAWVTLEEADGKDVMALFNAAVGARSGWGFGGDYYGSIAASRDAFHAVGGYDESLGVWGGDDDNIRSRLSMNGAFLVLDSGLALVHLSEKVQSAADRGLARHTADEWRALSHPSAARVNTDDWGRAFGRVARRPNAALSRLGGRLIHGGGAFNGAGRADVLALFSFRYDAHLVPALIENIAPFVDGWIAYDDRDSPDLFSDETDRRRVLIQAAHEAGARWALAVDPDERFERGLSDRIAEMTSTMEPFSWSFRFREMFEANRYRADGMWGRKSQQRLFPLRGDLMLSNRALHAPWCGFRTVDSGLNLYHLKMITPQRRQGRRALYNHLDPGRRFQDIGYDYLADDAGAVLEDIPAGREYWPAHQDDGGLWMPSVA